VPSGVVRPGKLAMIGNGVVIDPWALLDEIDTLRGQALTITPENLRIAENAPLILPLHVELDMAREKALGEAKIGTTGRGIGPTYADKINRIGLRFGDLSEVIGDVDWAETVSLRMNSDLSAAGAEGRIEAAQLAQEVAWIHDTFGQTVANTGVMLDNALKLGENVLLEGAQGCLLDIDQGTYPFVTSSVTSRGNATHGAGIHPGHIEQVIGIVKAYTTRVGAGPMPSELFDSDGDHMTDVGHEFGTTTGRRRRCGWLDLVVLRHANRVNGFTSMAMTKLDVLGGIDPLKICVGYRLDGKEIHEMPASSAALARCEPILIEMPGFPPEPLEVWLDLAKKADVEGLGYSALPSAAQAYIGHVENLLGVPITSVGIGPDRDATIERAD